MNILSGEPSPPGEFYFNFNLLVSAGREKRNTKILEASVSNGGSLSESSQRAFRFTVHSNEIFRELNFRNFVKNLCRCNSILILICRFLIYKGNGLCILITGRHFHVFYIIEFSDVLLPVKFLFVILAKVFTYRDQLKSIFQNFKTNSPT